MGWLSKLFNLDMWTEQALGTTLPKPPLPSTVQPSAAQTAETAGQPKAESHGSDGAQSKVDAKNRLKLVLMHDRTQLSAEVLEKMRDEIVEVISKYVPIDRDALDINLETESNTIALVANIPMRKIRGAATEDAKPEQATTDTTKTPEAAQQPANPKGDKAPGDDTADDLIAAVEPPKADKKDAQAK